MDANIRPMYEYRVITIRQLAEVYAEVYHVDLNPAVNSESVVLEMLLDKMGADSFRCTNPPPSDKPFNPQSTLIFERIIGYAPIPQFIGTVENEG